MKMQIKYNHLDFQKILQVAQLTAPYADIIALGSLTLFSKGIEAVHIFKDHFPETPLYIDAKITEKAEQSVTLFAKAGASYISILAGTPFNVVKQAVETARYHGIKTIFDFLNTDVFGQSAMDAKTLGIDGLLFHRHIDSSQTDLENDWQVIQDNSSLPLFIEGKIDKQNITQIMQLKPTTIVIGSAITHAADPAFIAQELKKLITQ